MLNAILNIHKAYQFLSKNNIALSDFHNEVQTANENQNVNVTGAAAAVGVFDNITDWVHGMVSSSKPGINFDFITNSINILKEHFQNLNPSRYDG